MDAASGLIFSPSHFTWMDTNHPAGTPRQGYPVEIQALWYAALHLLGQIEPSGRWYELAGRVRASIQTLYTRGENGGLSDCLHAKPGQSAADASADDALRPNQLLAITLGAITDASLCASILSACEELLVPGAIRSLADRPVTYPLPIVHSGKGLNDPHHPYWGQYEGDEDTRRKPAYHNGTAWTWLFPSYAEALVTTYGDGARNAALALLAGSTELINEACVGHVPEIVDGDTPHRQRGCGAQAWGATELYRVLAILTRMS
jgi:predicted glycogen debranching enzyme